MTPRCKYCGSEKIPPSELNPARFRGTVRCSRCINQRGIHRRAQYNLRQRQTPEGRAKYQAYEDRRIRYGHYGSFGTAQTPELARAIEDHIKRRMSAFQRLQARAETESDPDGAVAAETTAGDD